MLQKRNENALSAIPTASDAAPNYTIWIFSTAAVLMVLLYIDWME